MNRSKLALLLGLVFPWPAVQAQVPDPPEYVRTLYRVILEREPKKDEVNLWVRVLYAGTSAEEVRANFLGSDEFYRNRGRDLTRFFIGLSYQVNQRPPRQDEVARWGRRLIELNGNRIALALEVIRNPAPAPPPPPPPPQRVVVVERPVLPPEPLAIRQPYPEVVAQAEAGAVLVDLYLVGVSRCTQTSAVSALAAQSRVVRSALLRVRKSAAEGAAPRELRLSLRDAYAEMRQARQLRLQAVASVPGERVPDLDDMSEALDRLDVLLNKLP